MSIIETVKRICMEEAKGLVGAEVIGPLAVWDNTGGLMGVQIKAPKQMGPQACEVVANFTLSQNELKQAGAIRIKAALAAGCMSRDVQVQIRPLQKLKDVAPEALLGKPHAD
jgi:hypothetical protein